jgi:hypothetical protein
MKVPKLVAGPLLGSLFLIGCASTHIQKVDTSPEALAPIKTIAVIRPHALKRYAVVNLMPMSGMAFGAIGGAIAYRNQVSKEKSLKNVLENKCQTFPNIFADAIAGNLAADGYQTTTEDGPWEETPDGKGKIDFEKIQSQADAVLVVTPALVGFVTESSFADYKPTINAVATLLGKDRKQIIYQGYHSSGWKPRGDAWTSSEPKKRFSNFDALLADPSQSADALNDAARAIASRIGADLKR